MIDCHSLLREAPRHRRHTCRPLLLVLVLTVLSTAFPARAQVEGVGVSDDWARLIPGDVSFYVEMRGLGTVREQFRKRGIWNTVVEMREQDAPRERGPWQLRTKELLGLDAEEVITELLGRRSALLAARPADWDNGVLLAELGSSQTLERLLKDCNAKELASEGAVRRYQLGGGLTLAVVDRLIAIGPAGDPDGLWGRTVLLMAGQRGPTLAGRADFAALRTRLSPEPQGVLYTVWDRDDPTAVAGCRRMLLGVWLEADEIICELRGQRADRLDEGAAVDATALELMPATTLATWVGRIDFAAMRKEGLPSEEFSLAYLFLASFGQIQVGDKSLLESLGPNCRVLIGRDPRGLATGFDLPAITTILDVREGAGFMDTLDGLLDILAKSLSLMTTGGDMAAMERVGVATTRCEDVTLHSVAMGPALAERLGLPFLRRMEPCWAILDGQLVLSSSKTHVEEIVRALRGKGPRLTQTPIARQFATATVGREPIAEYFLLRSRAMSAMLTNWLSYVEAHHPQALGGEWWRAWAEQRMADRLRLGVALETDKQAPRRAVVVEVSEMSPALKYLMSGDVIVAVAGRPLGERAAQEVAERYRERGAAEIFELQILRGDKEETMRIPVRPATHTDLGPFDPARAVRQLAALARRTDTFTLCRYLTKPDRLDARIVIQWEREGQ